MIILGLGTNVGDRFANLRQALSQIRLIEGVRVQKVSPVYISDALLLPDAPKSWNKSYLNAAIGISTDLSPPELLAKLKSIEKKMGRVSSEKWSPRIIDIDILTWNEESFQSDDLIIPHKSFLNRPFALWPLADINPDYVHFGKSVKELIKDFGSRFDGGAPLNTKQINQRIDTPMMMGILNITPDSFSDGGKFLDIESVLKQAKNLFEAGADIIDIGAESTRPGSEIISPDEEWRRLKPILDAWDSFWDVKNLKPKLSVDTCKPETAEKLLSYNIDYFNDVGGLVDPRMQEAVKKSKAKIIFMHNLGVPADCKNIIPHDKNVVKEVLCWAEKQLNNLIKSGIEKERLIFDVGIGFGKDAEQSLDLIRNINEFLKLGVPILVGHSRKSFLGQFTPKKPEERDLETAVFSGFLADQDVNYLRVHNVDVNMRLLKTKYAI